MGLASYRKKRDFRRTTEPEGRRKKSAAPGLMFVVQKHAARSLHYDFRLELEGTLKSWAVPKGPSLVPGEKRLAVHVEDHPLEYGSFEGRIPEGEYGAGTVEIWDRGIWIPEGDPRKAYREGKMKFRLEGKRLHGRWALVRMGGRAGEDGKNWLLIKEKSDTAAPPEPARAAKRPVRAPARKAVQKVSSTGGKKRGKPKLIYAARIPGSRKASLPRQIEPQLATLASDPPPGENWIHEIKFDGYRILARIEDRKARLISRRGNDWTEAYATVARAAGGLAVREAFLDGEVVVLDERGISSFQGLQNAMSEGRGQLIYYVFDLLHLDGYDLRAAPLIERKKALESLLESADPRIRYSEHVTAQAEAFHAEACRHGLEGIVSKRKDGPYRPGRSRDWLKVKCSLRQELVIGGYTDPEGARPYLGALLMGVHDDAGRLLYSGKVGTGFSNESLRDLRRKLEKIERKKPPFADPPTGAEARGVHWVDPRLVGEVSFTGWTRDNALRHPSFQGLREDKPAAEVVREVAVSPRTAAKPSSSGHRVPSRAEASATVEGVKITHPERVLYPDVGLTKLEIARYYEEVSDWILPHVVERPLPVLRCPEGQGGACFFQKHAVKGFPESIKQVNIEEDPGDSAPYIYIDDLRGLISLVQFGVLELHPWGSRIDSLERPDRMTIDFDPGADVEWKRMVESARYLHERLEDLGLTSFLKTTGGKGLHVVVPLTRRNTWEEVKGFAAALAEEMVRIDPGSFIAKASKASRKGKIFVDYLRNGRGATAVAAYSTRARAGAPVSAPITWDELDETLRPDAFNVRNLPERLRKLKKDPWKGFFEVRQSIQRSMAEKVAGR